MLENNIYKMEDAQYEEFLGIYQACSDDFFDNGVKLEKAFKPCIKFLKNLNLGISENDFWEWVND